MFIKGKTALITGAATDIGLEYVKVLLKNGAQVSYIGWLHWHVREVVETRLHSHGTVRGSGYFIDKQSCYWLRKYVYQRTEFVTEDVHGSTLHYRTVIANCCNISHARFFPRHFIFRHKQNINVFKMLFLNCEEIWSCHMPRSIHHPWFYHCHNIWWGVQIINLVSVLSPFICSYMYVAKNYSTCRSLVHIITKIKMSLHATVYWYGRIRYKASFRISFDNLSLQNVAVCDVDVRKGEDAVRELQTEYGADRVIFIKTDVTNVAELEGNVENIWMLGNLLMCGCQGFEQKGLLSEYCDTGLLRAVWRRKPFLELSNLRPAC